MSTMLRSGAAVLIGRRLRARLPAELVGVACAAALMGESRRCRQAGLNDQRQCEKQSAEPAALHEIRPERPDGAWSSMLVNSGVHASKFLLGRLSMRLPSEPPSSPPQKNVFTLFASAVSFSPMYTAVTRDIKVTAAPDFVLDQSDPEEGRFFWAYRIEIANLGRVRVRLISRHWIIIDANGQRQEVKGLGVVGQQPVLEPGTSFSYESGCPLPTPSGIMQGSYRMSTDDGETFDVATPAFSLDSPHSRPILN